MTAAEVLRAAASSLSSAGIADARLEAEVLFMHALGVDRAQLYASLQDGMAPDVLDRFQGLLRRRTAREPLAYITGHREFFGIDLLVDRRVLVPRQETETLVETAIERARSRGVRSIVDVGTGSGAIAVALALHLPQAQVYAIDFSEGALAVARSNCDRAGVSGEVTLLHGDLLAPLPGPVDMIVANLPYIPDDEWDGLAPEVKLFEPESALRGGSSGADVIERLLRQAGSKLTLGGEVLLEIGHGQGRLVSDLARELLPGASTEVFPDLACHERAVLVSGVGWYATSHSHDIIDTVCQ